MLNSIIIGLVLGVLVIVVRRGQNGMSNDNVKNITAEDATELIGGNKNIIILDVRTKNEYSTGHIPGALLMPVGEITSRIREIEKYSENPVLVYCASGGRSPLAVKLLLKSNFKEIYHLSGGLSGWKYKLNR